MQLVGETDVREPVESGGHCFSDIDVHSELFYGMFIVMCLLIRELNMLNVKLLLCLIKHCAIKVYSFV
jgi:hypothetical protein